MLPYFAFVAIMTSKFLKFSNGECFTYRLHSDVQDSKNSYILVCNVYSVGSTHLVVGVSRPFYNNRQELIIA